MIKNKFLIKLSLFLVSTVICFFISELFLTLLVNKFETVSKFSSIQVDHVVPIADAERHDDIYELYQSPTNQYEIVAIGDSYTNGGNVRWEDTYPYKLFLSLDQKITVVNMGICEDTTRGSFLRITDYFKKNRFEKNNKQTIVALLVGAADVFFEDNIDFENVYKKIIDNNEISTEIMPVKLNKVEDFISDFKTFKMLSFIKFKISEEIKNYFALSKTNIIEKEVLDHCYKNKDSEKQICLVKYFKIINNLLKENNEKGIYKNILNYLIYKNQNDMLAAEKTVSDILIFIQTVPKSLILPDVIYNVVRYGTMQSRYDLELDILKILNQSYQAEVDYIKNNSYLELDNAEMILKALKKWCQTYSQMEMEQQKYYLAILDLVKTNNSKLILINYPRPYQKINNLIKKISLEKNIPFVNLEEIFNRRINNGTKMSNLIGDWEHCTPDGYSLIAESVFKEIIKIVN